MKLALISSGIALIPLDHGYRNLSPKELEIAMRLHLIKS